MNNVGLYDHTPFVVAIESHQEKLHHSSWKHVRDSLPIHSSKVIPSHIQKLINQVVSTVSKDRFINSSSRKIQLQPTFNDQLYNQV